MDTYEYFRLINSIKKLSKYGWEYNYIISYGETTRKMTHEEYGEFIFDTWLKLKIFTDKWKAVYQIED